MANSIQSKNKQRQMQMKEMEEYLMKDYNEDKVNSIVEEKPLKLSSKLKNGELTAVEVLKAFQCRALEITKRINCITEFIPEAQEWAEHCDTIPAKDRKPLHGLPISIKDSIDVKGMDSTLGLAKNINNPAIKHSTIVDILITNGALPFCKTNVPQLLVSFCCSNPVYGITLNPHNTSRTPGGSSGGECALIASGGSIAGIGTDMGGSARVPASFSGCCGIKLTSTRVSSTGFRSCLKGAVGVSACPGIMGRDAQITALVTQTLIESMEINLLDASILPIPWNEIAFSNKRKLTFGYYEENSYCPCTPGVKRAVRESKEALEKAGHKVIPFEMIDLELMINEVFKLVTADEGKTMSQLLKNEPNDAYASIGMLFITSYGWKRQILKKIIALRSQITGNVVEGDCYSTYDLWQSMEFRKKKIQELKTGMKENGIDLLLTPVFPLPAPQLDVPAFMGSGSGYAAVANYCDFTSGVLPVTKQNEKDIELLDDYPVTDYLLSVIKEEAQGALELPIGVCITGLSLQEELVLKGMLELEKALKQ